MPRREADPLPRSAASSPTDRRSRSRRGLRRADSRAGVTKESAPQESRDALAKEAQEIGLSPSIGAKQVPKCPKACRLRRISRSRVPYRGASGQVPYHSDSDRQRITLFGQETTMNKTSKIDENYGRFEDDDRSWDVNFWQRRGSAEIFAAVWGMILDHRLLTQGDASEPRLQRTVEHFGKA